MTLLDRDLISIQEARQALARAAEAQKKFAAFSQNEVDAVVEACAEAATAAGEQLARTAVEETGYGNVPDKIIKNRLASVDVPRAIRGMKTVGILREDREKGIIEIAEPVGVVAAVIPSTNPTSTTIYKTLISLKARNAVILSPHPTAMRCICETAGVLERAALKTGAPEGLIICLAHPTMQGTQELMKSRETGVILATGGTGLVRDAYSSGRPAFGVGPGNVPSFIERTANVRKAIADIFAGKTFDYGTICSSEQSIVAEEAVREQVLDECFQQGAYFLAPDEISHLGEVVFPGGSTTPSPKIVGRAATVIAEMAGLKVPASTRVLIAKLDGVGREVPLSGEKLSPILAFYSAANLAAGIEICTKLLQYGGLGHTASIHSQNEAAVKQFGLAIPAFRIVVNTSAVHGSIGYSTNLFPAMTLGCGSHGGNITSDNIGPQHLMNIKRVAWESRPVEHRTIPAGQRLSSGLSGTSLGDRSFSSDVKPPIKEGALEAAQEVKSFASGVKTPDEKAAVTPELKLRPPKLHDFSANCLAPEVSATPGTTDATPASAAVVPDRQTIARIVEQVFAARGISRGGTPKPDNPLPSTAPLGAAAAVAPAPVPVPTPSKAEEPRPKVPAPSTAAPKAPPIEVAEFVCEDDARSALEHNQKIFLGPKTIVTPSARDFGNSNDLFVVTDIIPTPTRKRRQ